MELSERDAIVHRRIEKKDEYAVIEWGPTGLSVRSSSTDKDLAHALAVAGLHEIEELVADEISPLPDASTPPGEPGDRLIQGGPAGPAATGLAKADHSSPNGGNGHGAAGIGTNGNGHSNGNGRGANSVPAGRLGKGPSRPLVLAFKTKSSGLSFQALWAEADRKTRVPALGAGAHANGNGHISSGERAKLIGLAAYARKAHFHYDQDTGVYLLESLVVIPNFLKTTLSVWRRIFTIELDDKAAHLGRSGTRRDRNRSGGRADRGGAGRSPPRRERPD